MTSEETLRDAELVREALAAAAAGPLHAERAADCTTRLIFGRPHEEVYGVCCSVAQYAVDAVTALACDRAVGAPEQGGPWRLDVLRPPLMTVREEDLEDAGIRVAARVGPQLTVPRSRPVDPGDAFAYAFTTAYAAGGKGSADTTGLFMDVAEDGLPFLTYCVAHLVRHVALITSAAADVHLSVFRGRTT
ncbi:hypothetical protein GR925_25795 [Streptomyces sp. HUCO-GS316]|uniref:hypothetical protein n=1 Tax=Streptomyces sp. HUCO-GS316 TaxID=2692198 RepID=UPI00136D34A4|nr:hypothetical protein [Streptomyces sp. HUCO-GS316]MXM66750.1 hypothetical protein [Streptomyces sp. HUCO-GS316]